MNSFLTLLAVLFARGLASELQGDVVRDPQKLCSSPLEELKSLERIQFRQYTAFGERVGLSLGSLGIFPSRFELLYMHSPCR